MHRPALSGKMGNGRPGKLLKNQGWSFHCRSENPRVGSSILPPATTFPLFNSVVKLSASNLMQLNCRAVKLLTTSLWFALRAA